MLINACLLSGSYSYVVNVVAVTEVEMADEIPAVVSWVTMRQRHTHGANLWACERTHRNTELHVIHVSKSSQHFCSSLDPSKVTALFISTKGNAILL